MRHRTTLGAALIAVILCGCSSSPDDGASAEGPDGATSPGGAGEAPAGEGSAGDSTSPSKLPNIPVLRHVHGILDDLQLDDCPTATGVQRVAGSVTNPGRGARDVVVAVNWTNDTYDVLARGVAVLRDVAPGRTREWHVEADLGPGVTTCTPSARAGDLASG